MRLSDIYDEIRDKCGCGSKTFIVYDATIIGGVDVVAEGRIGIKHLAKKDQEHEHLVICPKCQRVRVCQGADFAFNMIGE